MDKEEPSSTRYFKDSYKVDIFSESSHALAVKLIGKNKRILEIGTSTGPLTECLSYLDNTIIGIEIDPEAAEKAAEFCERMIIADVETMDFADFFGEGEFDCILMTDVLEHLKWPEKILRDIRRYLSKNGFLVVSIPNICHGDVILNMLKGDFEYRETGLLDLTHIRFFALKNIIELFSKENYTITDLQRVKIKIGKTELKIKEEIPLIFVALLNAVPESDTYQYVFKAEPVDNAKTPIISSSLNQVAVEAEIGLEIRIFHLKIENDALKLKISSVTDQLHAQKTEHQSLQKQFQRQSIELASMKESIGWFFFNEISQGN